MSQKEVTLSDVVELISNLQAQIEENNEIINERIDEIVEKLDNVGLPGSDYGVIDT